MHILHVSPMAQSDLIVYYYKSSDIFERTTHTHTHTFSNANAGLSSRIECYFHASKITLPTNHNSSRRWDYVCRCESSRRKRKREWVKERKNKLKFVGINRSPIYFFCYTRLTLLCWIALRNVLVGWYKSDTIAARYWIDLLSQQFLCAANEKNRKSYRTLNIKVSRTNGEWERRCSGSIQPRRFVKKWHK